MGATSGLLSRIIVHAGTRSVLESFPEGSSFGSVFEDDRDTGYFYGLQAGGKESRILDALHIYDVGRDVEADQLVRIDIRWSEDHSRTALLVDGLVRAAFDFANCRAVCRSDFPPADGSFTSMHRWDDSVVDWLYHAGG
jgi:hypothetical protein